MDIISSLSTIAVVATGAYLTAEIVCLEYIPYTYLKEVVAPQMNGRYGKPYFTRKFVEKVKDAPLTPIAKKVSVSIANNLEKTLINERNTSF